MDTFVRRRDSGDVFAALAASTALAPHGVEYTRAMTLTPSMIVVTVLSLVLGLVTQMVQTGSFLGIKTTPQTWLPYLTLAATFLGGVVTSLAGAAAINAAAVFAAVVAGIQSLLAGAAPGVAHFAHVTVPAQIRASRQQPAAPPPPP